MGTNKKWTDEVLESFKVAAKTMTNAQLAKEFCLAETTVKKHKSNLGLTQTRNNLPKRPPKRTGYEIVRVNDYTTRCVRLG
ncbi:MAG: hypothetical protein PHP85_14670 [Gallionella sp.]|nr:hypothetical protein [Gallionella sp.]